MHIHVYCIGGIGQTYFLSFIQFHAVGQKRQQLTGVETVMILIALPLSPFLSLEHNDFTVTGSGFSQDNGVTPQRKTKMKS